MLNNVKKICFLIKINAFGHVTANNQSDRPFHTDKNQKAEITVVNP